VNRREFLAGVGAVAATTVASGEVTGVPEKKHRPYRWEKLTAGEFDQAVKDCGGVCVVPLGCIEKHGMHLPLGTDCIVAQEICLRAAQMEKAVVFPSSPFGWVPCARHTRGTLALSHETMARVFEELCDELARNGLNKIIVYSDHGGNAPFMRQFLRTRLQEKKPYTVYYIFKCSTFTNEQKAEAARRIGEEKLPLLGHAEWVETSEMMAICPGRVHLERQNESDGEALDRLKELSANGILTPIDWYATYPHQIAGSNRWASKELGEWLLDTWAGNLARSIRLVREDKKTAALIDEFFEKSNSPVLN